MSIHNDDDFPCQNPAIYRMISMSLSSIFVEYLCEEHLQLFMGYMQNPTHGEKFGYVILDIKPFEDCEIDPRRDMLRAVIKYDSGKEVPFDGWQH
jgi:hypothetical protein